MVGGYPFDLAVFVIWFEFLEYIEQLNICIGNDI